MAIFIKVTVKLSYLAGFLGLIQVLVLSERGRATSWVGNLEPRIRRKWFRWKYSPPLIVAVNRVEEVSSALSSLYSKPALLVHCSLTCNTIQRLIEANLQGSSARFGPYRLLRRKGHPYAIRPWTKATSRSMLDSLRLLELMGLDSSKKFVLLSLRDASYYEYLYEKGARIEPGAETHPNTFIRNPRIETYVRAAQTLVDRGFHVIRFGISRTPLDNEIRKVIFDYSSFFRTPERDLILAQNCELLLNGASGAWCFASIFNKPVAGTNHYGPPTANGTTVRQIPQLLREVRSDRLFTFREMQQLSVIYSYSENCERDGIELVKNTAEEIEELVLEVLGVIAGGTQDTDIDLLKEFDSVWALDSEGYNLNYLGTSSIGMGFLRRYRHLLE